MKSQVLKRAVLLTSLAAGFSSVLNTVHWTILVVGGSLLGLGLYFSLLYASKVVADIQLKNIKKVFIDTALALGIAFLAFCFWFLIQGIGIFTGIPIPHLRTNVFTGECTLNISNDVTDPWYYAQGCEVSKDEKIQLLKNDSRFGYIQIRCESYESADEAIKQRLVWDEVTCNDLLDENTIVQQSNGVQSENDLTSPSIGQTIVQPIELSISEVSESTLGRKGISGCMNSERPFSLRFKSQGSADIQIRIVSVSTPPEVIWSQSYRISTVTGREISSNEVLISPVSFPTIASRDYTVKFLEQNTGAIIHSQNVTFNLLSNTGEC